MPAFGARSAFLACRRSYALATGFTGSFSSSRGRRLSFLLRLSGSSACAGAEVEGVRLGQPLSIAGMLVRGALGLGASGSRSRRLAAGPVGTPAIAPVAIVAGGFAAERAWEGGAPRGGRAIRSRSALGPLGGSPDTAGPVFARGPVGIAGPASEYMRPLADGPASGRAIAGCAKDWMLSLVVYARDCAP